MAVPNTQPGPVTAYNPAYGGVPGVPSLVDVYGQATGANAGMLPGLNQIGANVTGANQQELLNNLRVSIPGYDQMTGASSGNIESLLAGQIPTDVRNQITQSAAERGISTGLYDSPNSNAALLRSLGLTSLGLQSQGEQELTGAVNRTPQAKPFDISPLMINPNDLYQSQLLANIYASSPQPAAAAAALISQQQAGYNTGRGNVPSYSQVGGGGYSPASTSVRAPYSTGYETAGGGNNSSALEWDPRMGAYWNKITNSYVTPDEDSSAWITSGAPTIQDPTYPDMYGADPTLDPGASFEEFFGGE